MSKRPSYLIDERTLDNLNDVLVALELGNAELGWYLLSGIIEDIKEWCEVDEKCLQKITT